jgi:hypothetical protein
MNPIDEVFSDLRAIMVAAAGRQVVTVDKPGRLVVRSCDVDGSTGELGWFGTVTVKEECVAYHLMPLYGDDGLDAAVSPALRAVRHGRTCFRFQHRDPALFADLAALTQAADSG